MEVVAHYESWTDPDSRIGYNDVLEVHYWGRYPEETSKEIYFLAPWLGTIRFVSLNEREPSGVHYQYAEYFERYSPPDTPTFPWFDAFENRTHVPNGFFEDFLASPVNGAPIAGRLRGWSGSRDAVISNDALDAAGTR